MTVISKKFYHLFWTDPICQTIFSSHKSHLLENEVELIFTREKFYAKRLVLTNSQKRKHSTQALKRKENQTIDLLHDYRQAVSKYLDENRIESHFRNRFGKTIQKLETDLNKTGGWLKLGMKLLSSLNEEKDLFKLLGEYHILPLEIESKEQFIKHFEKEFILQVKEFIKEENLSDLAISIDLISTYYNLKIVDNLLSATKHYTDVLYDSENYKDRIDFFDNLYEIGLIKGGKLKSHYECVNCPPNVFNGVLTINLKPSQLKLNCPCCKKELYYAVPYELDSTIYNHIIDKDGLLFYAIKYLLEENEYKYQERLVYGSDIEIDICLTNELGIYEIIEVKMFKTDRPEDTQIGNIRDAVGQMKKMIDKLSANHNEGFKHIQYSLITNIQEETIYSAASKQLSKDLKEYNINLYSISDFFTKVNR